MEEEHGEHSRYALSQDGGAGNIASALVNALSQDEDNFIVIADNLLRPPFFRAFYTAVNSAFRV